MIDKKNAIKYCKDDISLIENYDKAFSDTTQMWHCHHRRETIFSRKDLIEIGEYYNRPACELIFLTKSEHMRLHHLGKPSWMKGKHFSEEARKKMSESKKGENNPLFGKHHSAETRKKMSEAQINKPKSAETRKKLSEARKGKHLSEETRKKLSEANKGKNYWTKGTHWYNNGVKCIKAKTCPEGFVKGRLKLCAKASLVTSS